ncbi:MAG: hypothetical protein K2P81_08620 [Bacteriovoracaceae bacterium]|nr:hypothetical protein [Bacteriovoracaceae bacterium]
MKSKILLLCALLLSFSAWGMNKTGRLGIGLTNQLVNDLPALSLKIQQNRYFALGGLLGFRSNEDSTLYGAGLKIYRVIFEENLLNFYLAGTFASLSYEDDDNKARTGYQADGTFGTEFHFEGIESIGFSFEFGVSANKGPHGRSFETLGNNFLKSAVHFYL